MVIYVLVNIIIIILIIVKIILSHKNQIMHNDLDLFIIGMISISLFIKNKAFFTLLLSRTIRLALIFTLSLPLTLMIGEFWMFRLNARLIFSQFNLEHNLEVLPKHPVIILSNYPALMIEHLVHGLLPRNTYLVVWEGVKVFTGRMVGTDHLLYTYKDCYKHLRRRIKHKVKQGNYIVAYPESNWTKRKEWYQVCQLRSGMFRIAKELKIPIIPMAIDHMRMVIHMDTYKYRLKLGTPMYVDDINECMKITHTFLQKTVRSFKYKGD